jgi:phage tail-like protein
VVWDGRPVAGVSKVSGLKRTTEVVSHRDGGDLSTKRHSPGLSNFEPITVERGITHDPAFDEWATKTYSTEGDGAASVRDLRKDITIELYNEVGQKVRAWQVFRCWVSEYMAVPELDANANAIALEHLILQNEGWRLDSQVIEPTQT